MYNTFRLPHVWESLLQECIALVPRAVEYSSDSSYVCSTQRVSHGLSSCPACCYGGNFRPGKALESYIGGGGLHPSLWCMQDDLQWWEEHHRQSLDNLRQQHTADLAKLLTEQLASQQALTYATQVLQVLLVL